MSSKFFGNSRQKNSTGKKGGKHKMTNKNYKQKFTELYNKYSDKFICTDKPTEKSRNPEHFLKRVVCLSMYESIFYDFLLSDPEEYPIDVNTVEIVNGKPETLIDYIDNIITNPEISKNYDVGQIKDLKSWLVEEYGAKKANELNLEKR